MVRLVGLEPTTGKTPVDFKPTAYANFATAAPATRRKKNSTQPMQDGMSGAKWGVPRILSQGLPPRCQSRQ
jgi:hypothetical protein